MTAAPVLVVLPTRAGAASAAEAEPECLADLVESGAVTRADFMVG